MEENKIKKSNKEDLECNWDVEEQLDTLPSYERPWKG